MKSHRIKKSITIIFILFLSVSLTAQVDTTEIEVENNAVAVNDKNNVQKDLSNSEKKIQSLKKQIKEEETKLERLEKQIEELESEYNRNSENIDKADYNRKINEYKQRKIKINEEIIAHESSIKSIERGHEFKKDFGKKMDKVFKGIKKHKPNHNFKCFNDPFPWYRDWKKKFNGHWAGLEFGFANFMNNSLQTLSEDELDFMKLNSEKSWSIKLNIGEFNIPIVNNMLGVTTGIGAEFNTWSLYQNVDIYEDENNIMVDSVIDKSVIDYKRNRLNALYITIPLLLEFQFQAGKHKFYISGGIEGSVRVWSQKNQKYFIDNIKYKDRVSDDFQLSPFRYSATVRIGYGPIGLFANYSFEPLFRNGHGPELYPLSIGLRLINF